ncbi:MAG TPA: hypothetical protein DEB39_16310 [Planctomycetaceae bacterium]|nr:hypothetical protein [Planctomycetaceae bacterium]
MNRFLSPSASIAVSIAVSIAPLAVVLGGCMGYRVGTKTLFSQDIETVYVPIFKAEAGRQHMAERLSEAVIKRIEAKSHYKVVARPNADSTLEGEIITEKTSIALTSPTNDPRQKALRLYVQIRWVDRRQREIRQFDDIPWRDDVGTVIAETNMIPEFGHSQVTAEQTLINDIADKIVGMMEVPW